MKYFETLELVEGGVVNLENGNNCMKKININR
jgi:hypothetical protein